MLETSDLTYQNPFKNGITSSFAGFIYIVFIYRFIKINLYKGILFLPCLFRSLFGYYFY
jgi:hypothetical protein